MFMIVAKTNSLEIPCLAAETREELVNLLRSHGVEIEDQKIYIKIKDERWNKDSLLVKFLSTHIVHGEDFSLEITEWYGELATGTPFSALIKTRI